jgi:glycosyltransferase involved in cell wall biosynthesis
VSNEPQTSLSVLVPVFNEQYLVATSLDRLKILEASPQLSRVEVIVVDDCSRDETPQALASFRQNLPAGGSKLSWKFLRHEKNQGKGKAVQTGLAEATCDITVIHDADLEYHPKDLLRIVGVFLDEEADAVFGSRFVGSEVRRAMLFRHELGNRLLTFFTNLVTNINLTDMETCYKAVRTDLLKSLPLVSNDFRLEPELTIKLAKRGARIYEVPISYSGRSYAEGKKINWRDGFRALTAIARFAVSDSVYREDAYGSQTLARLSRAPRFNAWMADVIRPFCGNHVLEIGGGVGNLSRQLIPRRKYVVSDINPLYLAPQAQSWFGLVSALVVCAGLGRSVYVHLKLDRGAAQAIPIDVRYAGVRGMLQPDEKLAYISDEPRGMLYQTALYSLAPHIFVDPDAPAEHGVIDLHDPKKLDEVCSAGGWRPIAVFAQGNVAFVERRR